jgi:hypothetical protein
LGPNASPKVRKRQPNWTVLFVFIMTRLFDGDFAHICKSARVDALENIHGDLGGRFVRGFVGQFDGNSIGHFGEFGTLYYINIHENI